VAQALLKQGRGVLQGGPRAAGLHLAVLLGPALGRGVPGPGAEALAQRQPGPQEGDGGPQRSARQAQGAVDGLGAALGVAALLLDDGLADQRPVVVGCQAVPATQQGQGLVHLPLAVMQAGQPVVSRQAARGQAQQYQGAGAGGVLAAGLLLVAR